jgi:hypothetical protein
LPTTQCTTPSSISASLTNGEQAEVALLVRQCFDVLDTFGKTPEQLTNIIKAFVTQLSEYPYDHVRTAFRQYLKRNSKMPTPADIVNLIDPPKEEWKPDWSAYNALKKRVQRDGYFPYGSEKEFLRLCDEYAKKRALASVEPASEEERTARLIATGEKTFALEGPEA